MNTLDSALNAVTLALAGKTLKESMVLSKKQLPTDVHAEYDHFVALLGTDQLFSLYNTKSGIQMARPRLCLDIETGKAVILTGAGLKTVKPSVISAAPHSTTLEIIVLGQEGTAEEDIYYSLPIADQCIATKGLVPSATLANSPAKALYGAGIGFSSLAKGILKGAVRNGFNEGTDKEFFRTVIKIDDQQYQFYRPTADQLTTISKWVGKVVTLDKSVLSCGSEVIGLGGAQRMSLLPEGEYKIQSISYRTATSDKTGNSWQVLQAMTAVGEIEVDNSRMAGEIGKMLDGDNLTIVVTKAGAATTAYLKLTNEPTDLAERFGDLLAA